MNKIHVNHARLILFIKNALAIVYLKREKTFLLKQTGGKNENHLAARS